MWGLALAWWGPSKFNSITIYEANVDTSNYVELSNWWIWACQHLWIRTKEFEIIEIIVEEGVDLGSGIKDSLLPNVVL